jgi:hypothetical protein
LGKSRKLSPFRFLNSKLSKPLLGRAEKLFFHDFFITKPVAEYTQMKTLVFVPVLPASPTAASGC